MTLVAEQRAHELCPVQSTPPVTKFALIFDAIRYIHIHVSFFFLFRPLFVQLASPNIITLLPQDVISHSRGFNQASDCYGRC